MAEAVHIPPPNDSATRYQLRAYNRARLIDWLGFYPDLIREDALSSSASDGEGPTPWIAEIRSDPDARVCHGFLMSAVAVLKRRRYPLYGRLYPAYFAPNANPSLVEAWAYEATENRSVPDKMAVEDHREAIEFMLDEVENSLATGPRRTDENGNAAPRRIITVLIPVVVRDNRHKRTAERRARATDVFHRHLQDVPRHLAVIRTARETGYSAKEIRLLAREIAS